VLANIGVVLTLIATGGVVWRAGKGWFSCPPLEALAELWISE
jgi:hypothetical protein